MIRNIKGKICILKRYMDYDPGFLYIMRIANRLEIDALFNELFRRI